MMHVCVELLLLVWVDCIIIFGSFSWFLILFLSTIQENGWEEHPQNGLFCVRWDIKANSFN